MASSCRVVETGSPQSFFENPQTERARKLFSDKPVRGSIATSALVHGPLRTLSMLATLSKRFSPCTPQNGA